MIIWISSYPKSGNTWVRLFLESYFLKIKNNFRFGGFPELEDLEKLNLDYTNLNEIIKNWKTLQEVRNLDGRTNILKTHNALCTIGKYTFTDKTNTLGAIYLVRDPRDIVVSYANHLGLSFDEVIKTMLNSHASGIKRFLNYLKDLVKINVDINQMTKSIEDTSFEKLKKQEEIHGFDQATGNGPFFRKGIVGDWKNSLSDEQTKKIEKSFFNEMRELNYL